jgi:hypothetical protein
VNEFKWRVGSAHWRWLILGSLGVAQGCGGRSDAPPGGSTQDLSGGTPTTQNTPILNRCQNSTPISGGWERCENGMVHRSALGECASALPRPAPLDLSQYEGSSGSALPEEAVGPPTCRQDSDCTERPYGHCQKPGGGDAWGPFCDYGCVTDADCDEGSVCLCGEDIGQCYSATCSTDADCGAGYLCADYETSPGCPQTAIACQTAADTCAVNADCPLNQSCSLDGPSRDPITATQRHCTEPHWACGRPFLITGEARRANPISNEDWIGRRVVGEYALMNPPSTAALRERVGQGWLEQALMEHASVAAFARFTLELLSLGAPAELVRLASEAMQDEILHAEDCFALARRSLERPLGPGPLALDGAFAQSDLESIVLRAVAEGCIGETVAAMEAAEALAHCEDAAARPVLERIAADETRHAELAWRFVAWALERGPLSLRGAVQRGFADARAAAMADASSPAPEEQALARHGLLGATTRRALHRRVLSEVIDPCAVALLLRASGPATVSHVIA